MQTMEAIPYKRDWNPVSNARTTTDLGRQTSVLKLQPGLFATGLHNLHTMEAMDVLQN